MLRVNRNRTAKCGRFVSKGAHFFGVPGTLHDTWHSFMILQGGVPADTFALADGAYNVDRSVDRVE